MGNYHSEQVFNAPVLTVYEALTTPRGISGWWTSSCEVGEAVGELEPCALARPSR